MSLKRRNRKSNAIPVIGLIGGVASGKSFVAQALEELGCACINADKVGHELLDNPMIKLQLRKAFGELIFSQDGKVNRSRLGGIVFGNDELATDNLMQLNSIMHPAMRAAIVRDVIRLRQAKPAPPAIVLDAALLLEANWDKACDWIFFVDTPEPIRRQRALMRGWSESHWQSREKAQVGLDAKRKAATHFIPGDADEASLRRKLERLLAELAPQ